MSDYVRGLDRQQQLLFPDRLDDYVSEMLMFVPSMPMWMV